MASDLTKRNIDKMRLKPGEAQRDVYDSVCHGLVLRIGKKRKTWFFRYRVAGQKNAQPFKLGTYRRARHESGSPGGGAEAR